MATPLIVEVSVHLYEYEPMFMVHLIPDDADTRQPGLLSVYDGLEGQLRFESVTP